MQLLTPFSLGDLTVPNRVFMAPLSRTRCDQDNVPGELVARHYAQRASAGLLIAEATMVDPVGQAWMHQPAIHTDAHVAGWSKVTDAVHAAGGRIILQLWHPGRATHPDLNAGAQPVSATDRPIRGDHIHTPHGKKDYPAPRRLRADEIPAYVEMFRFGALNARRAGFDGVQIHGAHGYLLDQFLRDGCNDRTDGYGGSLAQRARLLFEVVDAACTIFGARRVGLRISPLVPYNDMVDSDPEALVRHVAHEADQRGLGHFELRHANANDPRELALAQLARATFRGPLLRNGGFDQATAEAALRQGLADAIVFGLPFIANPDLPRRFLLGAPLQAVDESTLYGHTAEGYVDYPALPV